MHFAIFIAAWMSFGQLSFDLSAVAAALDRTLESLQRRSFRAELTHESDPEDQKNKASTPSVVMIHAASETGHYFERKTTHEWRIDCPEIERPFSVVKKDKAWVLQGVSDSNTVKHKTVDISRFAWQLYYFGGKTLSEHLQNRHFQSAALKLDRKRILIWARLKQLDVIQLVEMRAIVRLSDSDQFGYCEWTKSLSKMLSDYSQTITSPDAEFHSEALHVRSTSMINTYFLKCKDIDDIPNCKNTQIVNTRIAIQFDIVVPDEQLSLQYYGITMESYDNFMQLSDPPKPHVPLLTKDQLDLAIAIGIPVVILCVLLIVIRKT